MCEESTVKNFQRKSNDTFKLKLQKAKEDEEEFQLQMEKVRLAFEENISELGNACLFFH